MLNHLPLVSLVKYFQWCSSRLAYKYLIKKSNGNKVKNKMLYLL